MKKSLVLAMAMALGVTASAYAANPFTDVPAGHWAYDSVAELAEAGVVDGYADGSFGGDKLMTRYEMAQITARAMANGADVDALAAEFAEELDTMGVRVANLEKKADNVKITGQIRAHYQDKDGKDVSKLRTRLFVKGQINEDWSYTGRLQNEQVLTDKDGNDETKLNWAFLTGKVGGLAVQAGRQDFKPHTGNVLDTTVDGVKAAYGDKVKVTGYAAKAANGVTGDDFDRLYVVDAATKLGVVDTYVSYYKLDADTEKSNEVFAVGAGMKVAKNLGLKAEWLNGDAVKGADDNGYFVGLSYKGAKAAKVGSFGLYANYFDQPAATYLKHTAAAFADGIKAMDNAVNDGFKGYEVGAKYTVAKNIVAGVKYFDLEAREGKLDKETIWSEVVFTF